MKLQKYLFILVTLLFLMTISSCDTNVKVKVYIVKDDVYFTHPLGYVEIEKECGAQIEEDDLCEIIKQVHGVDDENMLVNLVEYKLFKDANLTQEIEKNYKVNNNETIYALVTAKINSIQLGANNLAETSMWYTGSAVPEGYDENFFYPLNSLYVSGYYIPLDSETVSFDLLYEVFVNYRRTQELIGCKNGLTKYEEEFNVDLTCKDKFCFVVTSIEQLNNSDTSEYIILQENDTFTFDQQRYLIEVCYDGKNLGTLSWGHC